MAPSDGVVHLIHEVVLAEREYRHEIGAVLQRFTREAASVAKRQSEAAGMRIDHLVLPANRENPRLTPACAVGVNSIAISGGVMGLDRR